MSHPTLRLFDGADSTSPQLRDEVKLLQTILNQDGASLTVDGIFSRDTESAVQRFQSEHALSDDGVVGPFTWAALTGSPPPDPATSLLTNISPSDASMLAQLEKASVFKTFIQAA